MTSFSRQERAALCDLLDDVGPDAPTLCEGWTTRDMAAHLVIRERRPDASLGLVFKPLAGYMEGVRESTRDGTDYAKLVEEVRSGPPRWSPMRLGPLDDVTNTMEYFVHHEDVRRGRPGWEPRTLDPGLEQMLWSRLKRGAKLMMRRAPVGVLLKNEHGEETVAKAGEPQVTLQGKASEFTLFSMGRGKHARLEPMGAAGDVERLMAASFGI